MDQRPETSRVSGDVIKKLFEEAGVSSSNRQIVDKKTPRVASDFSASALLPSWVKPWPIQTTPASIGSMMMPYGAWTSNVVWSGTVWGTRVNHHLPSKPGNLERVEAWCVLLSQVLSL